MIAAGGGLIGAGQVVSAQLAVCPPPRIMGANTLSVALGVDNVLNGFARLFFVGKWDRIGRKRTMTLVSLRGAVSYWLLAVAGHDPWGFVTCACLISSHGERFSLCSPPLAPIRSGPNMELPMPASSITRRVFQLYSRRWRMC
jgi:hypothetical protein